MFSKDKRLHAQAMKASKDLGSVYYEAFIQTKEKIDRDNMLIDAPEDIKWFYTLGPIEELGAITSFLSVQNYIIGVLREIMSVEAVIASYDEMKPFLEEAKIAIKEASGIDTDSVIPIYMKRLGTLYFIRFHHIAAVFGDSLVKKANQLGNLMDQIKNATIH